MDHSVQRKTTQTTLHDSAGLQFSDTIDLDEIPTGSPPIGTQNADGVG